MKALKILAGKVKPNLGDFTNPPTWETIIHYYRGNFYLLFTFQGSELQNYFKKIVEDSLTAVIKPQHVFMVSNAPLVAHFPASKTCRKFEQNHCRRHLERKGWKKVYGHSCWSSWTFQIIIQRYQVSFSLFHCLIMKSSIWRRTSTLCNCFSLCTWSRWYVTRKIDTDNASVHVWRTFEFSRRTAKTSCC